MKIVTDYRGEVEYSEEDIIYFEDGMYGFDGFTDYLLIGNVEEDLPFYWFQSTKKDSLSFVITDPFLFVENYDFEIDELTVKKLEIESIEDIHIYSTVIIPDSVEDITINLKSPIVINIKNRKAKQIILDGEYPFKYNIFKKGEN